MKLLSHSSVAMGGNKRTICKQKIIQKKELTMVIGSSTLKTLFQSSFHSFTHVTISVGIRQGRRRQQCGG
jgi:hypothetical protein